jgi:hypothetical protein
MDPAETTGTQERPEPSDRTATSAGRSPRPGGWPVRLTRLVATLLFLAGLVAWLRPVNVPGRNFQPFGCGTAASPMAGQLAETVCHDAVSSARVLALCLVAGAALLLAIGELLLPRLGAWASRVAVASSASVPLLALGTARLLAPVTAYGADGTNVPCGTAIAPTTNALAQGICATLPQAYLVDASSLVGAAVLIAVGVLVVAGRPGGDPAE